jgi:hypothetical protein
MATTPRFTPGLNQDKTARTITQDYQNPAYAATIAITPVEQYTLVNVQELTGNASISIATSVGSSFNNAPVGPYVGDEVEFLFAADSSNRTVTFSTGFASSASTLVVVAAKFGSAKFKFNGTVWQEVARTLTA